MNPLIPIIALCIRLAVENQALGGAAVAGAAGHIAQNPLVGGVLGAALARPQALVLAPLRGVGRRVYC